MCDNVSVNTPERLADYRRKHADHRNLALHVATVPLVPLAVLTLASCVSFPAAAALAAVLAFLAVAASPLPGAVVAVALMAFLLPAHAASLAHPAIAAAVSAAVVPLAIGLQGWGHSREAVKTAFRGPADFAWVLAREQLWLAPLYLAARAIGRAPAAASA